ncbi:glycosyltransferase [Gramella sp. MT6]|uniref:glycosyltransferase n=1 Tax=Gramella sp. MT6 TaxID=2705471 RepID=UPI001C606E9D|nr:glycosyltransferase [Gramella sp. MT6]QYA26041.1 glycosyltransferase [Gramella sp. MT6]
MKVLYLIDTLEGYGAEKSLAHITCNFKNITPIFVHIYKGATLKPYLESNGIKVYSLNFSSKYSFSKVLPKIEEIYQAEKPDIIHATLFRSEIIARKLKKKLPEIILIGSFVSNSYSKQRFNNLSIVAKAKLISIQFYDFITSHHVDKFICNSYAIKETNSKALRISDSKIKVIYRGRSPMIEFNSELNIKNIRHSLGINNKDKVFINVSRLQQGKGHLDLIKAFSNLKVDYAKLLIAGEGLQRSILETEIKKLGLKGRVFLLGYRDDINKILKVSDYFVFPSYYEGLPGALIEAIFAKKPIIYSDIPENRECMPNEAGLKFNPGDIQKLAYLMKSVLEKPDDDLNQEIAYKYAKVKFDIQNVSSKYENFYKNLNIKN